MANDRIIEVDESLARAIRDENLDGRGSLMDDLRRGHHAKAVISEMAQMKRAATRGEHGVAGGDLEMRLEGVFHGTGFHHLAAEEGTYECWDDSDFINWRLKRFGQTRVRYAPRKTTVVVPGLHGA